MTKDVQEKWSERESMTNDQWNGMNKISDSQIESMWRGACPKMGRDALNMLFIETYIFAFTQFRTILCCICKGAFLYSNI